MALVAGSASSPGIALLAAGAADVRPRLRLQRGLLNFTLGRDILPPLLVTFGLSIIIQNGLLEVFSADSRSFGRAAGQRRAFIDGASRGRLVTADYLCDRVVLTLALAVLFARTRSGVPSARPPTTSRPPSSWASTIATSTRWRRPRVVVVAIAGVFSGLRTTIAPTDWPGTTVVRLRGRHHRRTRLVLGNVRRAA